MYTLGTARTNCIRLTKDGHQTKEENACQRRLAEPRAKVTASYPCESSDAESSKEEGREEELAAELAIPPPLGFVHMGLKLLFLFPRIIKLLYKRLPFT